MLIKIIVNGESLVVPMDENKTLVEVLHENGIEIKTNCESNGVCGKCHVVIDDKHYDELKITDFELDTLEKQTNLTKTSRLACQLKMVKELDGAEITVMVTPYGEV
ncbi:MAG: 2Fe-2S iron-sulfur cluster binding domain-containing protein [Rickettsiales bacterium]|jgi:ferredoxin|nr:2Fe-2S iron-sulfur cluster binding domain-containing protein [Rickettsiales bacterium]